MLQSCQPSSSNAGPSVAKSGSKEDLFGGLLASKDHSPEALKKALRKTVRKRIGKKATCNRNTNIGTNTRLVTGKQYV